jgi:hypothetical protein
MAYHGPTVSVQMPEPIYRRLKRIAEITHRSVEDVLATTFDVALPPAPDLPPDLADDLAAMTMFSDDALWAAAESSLSPAQQRRLSQLTHAGGRRTLTAAESAELEHLLDLYDRSVLRRARALAVLAHRGYDIPNSPNLPDTISDGDENPQTPG